jgi:hypothetical protein
MADVLPASKIFPPRPGRPAVLAGNATAWPRQSRGEPRPARDEGELRRWYRRPIIVLSGRASPGDKIGALDAGADDYLTKPFVMGELLARLRAALRREEGQVVRRQPSLAAIGRWQVDLTSRQVTRAGMGYRYLP